MATEKSGNSISIYLAIGLPVITLGLLTGSVTDPVNAPKLAILGAVAIASLFLLFADWEFIRSRESTLFKFGLILFVFWSFLSVMMSDSPLSQNIYGVYGRNTGFLAYLFLAILALAASHFTEIKAIEKVLFGFYVAVALNLIYCMWVIVFGDFVGWQNPYGALLGTFGNPNFISSFLGMSVGPQVAHLLAGKNRVRVFYFVTLSVTAFELIRASSLQGFVVSAVSIGLVLTYWISNRFISRKYTFLALLLGALGALTAVWGALGSGPLRSVMSQPTVALREQYWYAGIQMGLKNPVFGVGMDSYGDWYRRSRGAQALITPGPETVTNVAHNVFIDVLSYGGFPLLAAYALLAVVGLVIALRTILKHGRFEPIRISLAAVFITYQIQSVISINQIGLAIWGWTTLGMLISLDKILRQEASPIINSKPKKSKSQLFISKGLIGSLGLLAGFFIACPPLVADMKWSSALKSRQLSGFENALQGSYFSPVNSFRLAQATETLENSKLPDLAVKYARRGVSFNPESLNAWEMLYYATNSTEQERTKAKAKLISLDPLNMKWQNLK